MNTPIKKEFSKEELPNTIDKFDELFKGKYVHLLIGKTATFEGVVVGFVNSINGKKVMDLLLRPKMSEIKTLSIVSISKLEIID